MTEHHPRTMKMVYRLGDNVQDIVYSISIQDIVYKRSLTIE